MENRKEKSWKKYVVYLLLIVLGAAIVATVLAWRYYVRTVGTTGDMLNEKQYDRHYVMITENSDSLLWQDIYRTAKREASKQNAYLELLGEWGSGDYSLTDYMNIAVASNVDGIIVKPDGTARFAEAIDRANEAGIPVITVMEDESSDSRKSFVGVNSYQMGTTYGREILSCMRPDTRKVTVLLNQRDAGKDLVFKQLKATVQEGISAGQNVEINSLSISQDRTFGVEEVIRNLFHEEETRPDILVCMSEMSSECAYYAMVDYNQVGSVQMIGYYQSESMMSGVQKGIIPVVVTIDTEQMGAYTIEALEEYYSMGYTSNYFSVDLDIITQENVESYLPEQEEQ